VSSSWSAPSQQLACNGQPGVAKPGTDRIVYMGIGAVEAIIGELTSGLGAVAAATWFAGKSYDLLTVCGSPDPGDPGMTIQDWVDLVDYARPQVNIPAGQKAAQWFTHVMWPVWCNCSDGTTPPANTPPGPPPNQPNPNSPSGTIGANCWYQTKTKATNKANGSLFWGDVFPAVPPTFNDSSGGTAGVQTPIPSSVTITLHSDAAGSNPLPMNATLTFHTTSGANIPPGAGGSETTANGPIVSFSAPIPATAANYTLVTQTNVLGGDVSTNNVTVTATIYCQGQSPTSVPQPCCPPDPSVDLRLGALMDMMTQLLSLQPLQGAYQDTIHHTGLSGEGTISINPASSAIRFDVTSDLTNWPNHPQIPTYYLSMGFVTPFAVGTPLKGQRLVYNHQIFTWPSYTDQIGYSFAAGLSANLVELTRGA
jgi:hypothetical protein